MAGLERRAVPAELIARPEHPRGEDPIEERLDERRTEEALATVTLEANPERLFQRRPQGRERWRVSRGLEPGQTVAGVRSEQPGQILRLGQGGPVGEGPGKEFAEPRTRLAGEGARSLQLAPEAVRICSQPEGFELGRTARPVPADQHEVAQVRDQHQAIVAPVTAHLIRLRRQPGVFAHSLHLYHAPLRDLSLPRPPLLNLPCGVEGIVWMPGTLISPLQNAEDLRLERAADRADQVGQRRIVRPLPGRATRSAYPSEIGEIRLDRGDQLLVWSGHGAPGRWGVPPCVEDSGSFGRYQDGGVCGGCRGGEFEKVDRLGYGSASGSAAGWRG